MTSTVEKAVSDVWAHVSQDALRGLLDLARRVLRSEAVLLSSVVADEPFTIGMSGSALEDGQLPLRKVCAARIIATGVPLALSDTRLEPDAAMYEAAGIGSLMGVPVRLSSGAATALWAVEPRPRAWNDENLGLICDIAGCIAGQIERDLDTARRVTSEAAQQAAALNAAEARLLSVADRIPGLVFERRKIDDTHATYTYFGARKSSLPGAREMTRSGVSGDLSFVHPDDREAMRAAIRQSIIEETDVELTFRVAKGDGAFAWLRSQAKVRRDGDEGAVWDGLCFNITDLVAAREEAEAARAEKEAALVNVSHELRSPLQAILGFSEFLSRETRPELVAAHARNIRIAADSMLCVVNQLLELAGAEAGAVCPEPVAMRDFAEACLSMVGPRAVAKSIESRLDIGADVPGTVLVDRQKLQQALVNLLNNAVKFTEAGSFALRIESGAGTLRFSVTDTGIGIPPEKRNLLFQRFSRVAPATRGIDGTGLGLAITKTLVEQMQGRIGVRANTPRGTIFWIEVPVAPAASKGESQPAPPTIHSPGARPAPQSLRVLLADDLDLNRRLIADMLSIDGHVVDCVADGAEAVRAARANDYDLVLMDMIMPGMDGLAATRAIRALPAPACTVPIVALTANSFPEQLDSCLKAGMDATLTKPMTFDALTEAVQAWTQGRTKAA